MIDKKQPTILVKKSDGTSVRMTLDEVKNMRTAPPPATASGRGPAAAVTGAVPPKAGKQHVPKHETRNMKHEALPPQQPLAATVPVTKIFVDEAKAVAKDTRYMEHDTKSTKPWQKTDASSPLEEKQTPGQAPIVMESPEKMTETTPIGPAKDVVEKVLQKTGWDVSDATRERLAPLIVSRVKDVRTDGQFLVHAMTPTHRGGVGLSPAQAEQLLAAIQSFLPQTAGMKDTRYKIQDTKPVQESMVNGQLSTVGAKPVMRDITPPPPTSGKQMGPKEEFASFTLADFKRLGATTDASLSRLKEKFDTLKSESHVLFLDVRDAWFTSPLVTAYVESMLVALRDKKRLSDVLAPAGSKEGITDDIVKSIVNVNRYISV